MDKETKESIIFFGAIIIFIVLVFSLIFWFVPSSLHDAKEDWKCLNTIAKEYCLEHKENFQSIYYSTFGYYEFECVFLNCSSGRIEGCTRTLNDYYFLKDELERCRK